MLLFGERAGGSEGKEDFVGYVVEIEEEVGEEGEKILIKKSWNFL